MYFRKEEEENYSMEMTPLVDVVFLLLIFFMVSTAFVEFPRQLEINLPTSKVSQEVNTLKLIEIEMTSEGKMYLNGQRVTVKELATKIEKAQHAKSKQALIRADKSVPYGTVVEVMGILQSAQITNINIAVK